MVVVSLITLFCILTGSFWQENVALKPADEYELLIDYKFQDRPAENHYKADFDISENDRKHRATGPLPYLTLQLKQLKLKEDEVRVKVINSEGSLIYNRKTEVGAVIKIDVGFIDDVKDRLSPHEFNILFLSGEKKAVSRIQLVVVEDGTFLVNNITKGKF